mgnify:CR=1 FL=1
MGQQKQRNHGIVIFVVVNNFNQQTKFVSNSALCRCYLYDQLYYLNGDHILWGLGEKKISIFQCLNHLKIVLIWFEIRNSNIALLFSPVHYAVLL